MDMHVSGYRNDIECSLCIVGAGMAGLTALFVASRYLGKGDTVVLIDRRPRGGGMWNDTYDYVRLHQPYEFFTVGNIRWSLNEPRDYLASGLEVQRYLDDCLNALRKKLNLIELFEHEFERHEEVPGSRGAKALIRCHPAGNCQRSVAITAERLVMAAGLDIQNPGRLNLTSDEVVSTAPRFLDADIGGTAPVYIVGGGKTAMDTAYALISRFPSRRLTLFTGDGTVFLNRDKLFPTGHRRWWSGRTMLEMLSDIAMRFDGTNEDALFRYFREEYALCPGEKADRFMFGILSEHENRVISEGADDILCRYLQDVVSTDDGPEAVFRDGTRIRVAPGSVFVNCTGHLLRKNRPYEPYLSRHGSVVSLNTRSSTNFSIAIGAYVLMHLYFLDELNGTPLYEIDLDSLKIENSKALNAAQFTQAVLNLLVAGGALNQSILYDCGANLDRWFPLVRRAGAILKLSLNRKRYIRHCRDALDRVESRFEVSCGPLKSSFAETSNLASSGTGTDQGVR